MSRYFYGAAQKCPTELLDFKKMVITSNYKNIFFDMSRNDVLISLIR